MFCPQNNETHLISASNGFMKGDPIIVWVLTMWSSSRFWMSSIPDRILVPVSRYTIKLNSTYGRKPTQCWEKTRLYLHIWLCSFQYSNPEMTHSIPLMNHLLHSLLQRVLFAGTLTDALKLLQEGLQVHLHILTKVCILCWPEVLACYGAHLLPVSLTQTRVKQS